MEQKRIITVTSHVISFISAEIPNIIQVIGFPLLLLGDSQYLPMYLLTYFVSGFVLGLYIIKKLNPFLRNVEKTLRSSVYTLSILLLELFTTLSFWTIQFVRTTVVDYVNLIAYGVVCSLIVLFFVILIRNSLSTDNEA